MNRNKVVYILGAGFSAPLGLPLMNNFVEKSKDQYFDKPEEYGYFTKIFDMIRELSYIKNFYPVDLTNIEEILSILEWQEYAGRNHGTHELFRRYLKDVIVYYMSDRIESIGSSWQENLFGGYPWSEYGLFVATILGYSFVSNGRNAGAEIGYEIKANEQRDTEYVVITLNYDLVLEQTAEFINNRFDANRDFNRTRIETSQQAYSVPLAKLHGSVDTNDIIPPTWNKGLGNEQPLPSWQLAYNLIEEANHIRIIGYSLPPTDTYVKYLLRAAVVGSQHLKHIDVLCLDEDGMVKQRYDDFISFKNYRFKSARTEEYLGNNARFQFTPGKIIAWPKEIGLDWLEKVHEAYFKVRR